MNTHRENDRLALVLAALSRTLTYGERDATVAIISAGMLYANAGPAESDAAWRNVEILAGWRVGRLESAPVVIDHTCP